MENVGSEVQRLQQLAGLRLIQNGSFGEQDTQTPAIPEIIVAPMGNMPVIKDLVVDMSSFWNHLEAVEPYVSTVRDKSQNESFTNT